jgi:hypothetical protein
MRALSISIDVPLQEIVDLIESQGWRVIPEDGPFQDMLETFAGRIRVTLRGNGDTSVDYSREPVSSG